MCWQCDNPQATEADYEAWLWDTIDRYGWAIQYVEPGRTAPSFAYTVGLSRYAEPELVVTGMRQERAGALLNKMAAHVLAVSTPWAGEHVQHTRATRWWSSSNSASRRRICTWRSRFSVRRSEPCRWCTATIAGTGPGTAAIGAAAVGSRCWDRGPVFHGITGEHPRSLSDPSGMMPA